MSEPVLTGHAMIQPVVLVGGRSTRFGRDKLLEPIAGSGVLVDRPIRALRSVFGNRVGTVGACSEEVARRADMVIPDPYPGTGPIGGVLAALRHSGKDVFVLPGDLACIDSETVLAILGAASDAEDAWCVLGRTDRPQPCIGLYRTGAIEALADAIAEERCSLTDAIPERHRCSVPISHDVARNVNRPDELPGGP